MQIRDMIRIRCGGLFEFLKRKKEASLFCLVFICAFLVFYYIQSTPTLADPDSFYHAKIPSLIKEEGVIKGFPWTQFSLFKDYYIDHHFLYHVILIPFVSIFNPFIGIKIATFLFALFSVILFYLFLKKFRVKFAFLYTILLLSTSPFIFRMSLAKTPAISFIFLLLGVYCLFKNKNIGLFILLFIYVWLYIGWPLILFFTLCYLLSNFIFHKIKKEPIKFSFKPLVSCSLGLISGIIINPYFPQNLFYYKKIYQMALFPYYKIIGIGGEWHPYSLSGLISGTPFVFILVASALTLFFIFLKKQSKESLALLFLTILLFVYTLKARRQVEYFIPFAFLFSAFSLNDSLKNIILKDYWLKFLGLLKRKRIIMSIILAYFFMAIPFIAIRNIYIVRKKMVSSLSFDNAKDASLWLKNNTPAGSIVFQSDWDIFPMLFYNNTYNYYLTGLDQVFMYEYNKDLYWLWRDITSGKKRENIYEAIKYQFKADYVLLKKDKLTFNNLLQFNPRFEKAYEDKDFWIYKLK